MSENKWTPGPWRVESDIYSNEAASDTTVLTADGAYTVARTGGRVGTEIRSDDEREANARLIASAPDLAAVVERLCAQFWQAGIAAVQGSNDPTEDLFAQALAALRAARGTP